MITAKRLVKDSMTEYSNYVAAHRILPAVDGLKKVQRRLILSAAEMGLDKGLNTRKSANLVGVTMSLHPHSDMSIYATLVNMVRARNALFTGRGNFGSILDSTSAASRYTEARLSDLYRELSEPIDYDLLPWIWNYDNTKKEALTLQFKLPGLMLNSQRGIGVGLVSGTPSFCINDICDFVLKKIDSAHLYPDLQECSQLQSNLSNGKGNISFECFYSWEGTNLVVSSLAPEVSVAKLTQDGAIKNLIDSGFLTVRNESHGSIIRIVFSSPDTKFLLNRVVPLLKSSVSFEFNSIVYKDSKIAEVDESKYSIRTLSFDNINSLWLEDRKAYLLRAIDKKKAELLNEEIKQLLNTELRRYKTESLFRDNADLIVVEKNWNKVFSIQDKKLPSKGYGFKYTSAFLEHNMQSLFKLWSQQSVAFAYSRKEDIDLNDLWNKNKSVFFNESEIVNKIYSEVESFIPLKYDRYSTLVSSFISKPAPKNNSSLYVFPNRDKIVLTDNVLDGMKGLRLEAVPYVVKSGDCGRAIDSSSIFTPIDFYSTNNFQHDNLIGLVSDSFQYAFICTSEMQGLLVKSQFAGIAAKEGKIDFALPVNLSDVLYFWVEIDGVKSTIKMQVKDIDVAQILPQYLKGLSPTRKKVVVLKVLRAPSIRSVGSIDKTLEYGKCVYFNRNRELGNLTDFESVPIYE